MLSFDEDWLRLVRAAAARLSAERRITRARSIPLPALRRASGAACLVFINEYAGDCRDPCGSDEAPSD
jgi:hypothetical protein